ncbi:reverse transcriptase [Senna tora]|uniref:Reverse transcriptase n=1 Tax=Senna tora TaxID=362788 RepID=A0A834WWB1_9FABA|nr:reverse transcriptase [Senna tora]
MENSRHISGELPAPQNPSQTHPHIQFGSFKSLQVDGKLPELRPEPSISVSSSENLRICSPWKDAIAIRVWGKTILSDILLKNLMRIWKLKAEPSISSIGSGFFLIFFRFVEDRWKALLHGPCVVDGHFVSITLWRPRFNPALHEKDISSPIWIKLECLPVEFYNRDILIKIGNSLGTFLGLDSDTYSLTKLKFARICILANLGKPLPQSILIDGYKQSVMAEGSTGFCLGCGKVNHPEISCPLLKPPPLASPSPKGHQPPPDLSWVTVRRKRNARARVETKFSVSDDISNSNQNAPKAGPSPSSPAGPLVSQVPETQYVEVGQQNKKAHCRDTANRPNLIADFSMSADERGNMPPNLKLDISSLRKSLFPESTNVPLIQTPAPTLSPSTPKDLNLYLNMPTNPKIHLHTSLSLEENSDPGENAEAPVDSQQETPKSPSPRRSVPGNYPQREICGESESPGNHPGLWELQRHVSSAPSTAAYRGGSIPILLPNVQQPDGKNDAQRIRCQNLEISEFMRALAQNGLLLVLPPSAILLRNFHKEINDILRARNFLTYLSLSFMRKSITLQGHLPNGAIVSSLNTLRDVDVSVEFLMKLETGSLDYLIQLRPQRHWEREDFIDSDDSDANSDDLSVGQNFGLRNGYMISLNILAWNVRGAASDEFRRVFADLNRQHKPNLVLLTETRVGGHRAQNIIRSLGFPKSFVVNPMGFAGGLWLLWDDLEVDLKVIGDSFQGIHTSVQVNGSPILIISFIYGSPIRERRKILWDNLRGVADIHDLPWLVCGDFNDVLHQDEKWGTCEASRSRIRDFQNCLDYCGLTDLGYTGPKFTWCNKRPNGSIVLERLDRFLGNAKWISLFPNSLVSHLPKVKSDHNPILLNSHYSPKTFGKRPFRCERIWINHPDFKELVRSAWTQEDSLNEALKSLKVAAIKWNKEVLGNIFSKKESIQKRLRGIGNAMSANPSPQLVILENNLSKEYCKYLAMEEELWASKARLDWLHLGDANTKYFHMSVIHRRRHNKIVALKDASGNWIDSCSSIKKLITDHFANLFKAIEVSDIPTNDLSPHPSGRSKKP